MPRDDKRLENLRLLEALEALRDLPDTCDFCGKEVQADKIEPQSGDQWACHACLDRWDEEDRDAEVARIMAMTEEELRQDCAARGTTLEAEAAKVKAAILKAIEKAKEAPMTNEAPRCPEPGCVGSPTFHALAFSGEVGPDLKAHVVECVLAADAHALCKRVAELEAENAILARYQSSLSEVIAQRDEALAELHALKGDE